MISFFVRLPYISINYMEARTQLCISQKAQLDGTKAHEKIDNGTYSTRKNTNGDRCIFRNTIDFL